MSDEELFLAEKKISDERARRFAQAQAAGLASGNSHVLIDLGNLVNAVRDRLRVEMSLASEASLALILDQIRDYGEEAGEEAVVMKLLRGCLTAAFIYEARCEAVRRLDSTR
jgi:hypothetical protein